MCVKLFAPVNGQDPKCTDENFYRSMCTFECKPKTYLPTGGTHMVSCMADKTWSGHFSACEGMKLCLVLSFN